MGYCECRFIFENETITLRDVDVDITQVKDEGDDDTKDLQYIVLGIGAPRETYDRLESLCEKEVPIIEVENNEALNDISRRYIERNSVGGVGAYYTHEINGIKVYVFSYTYFLTE